MPKDDRRIIKINYARQKKEFSISSPFPSFLPPSSFLQRNSAPNFSTFLQIDSRILKKKKPKAQSIIYVNHEIMYPPFFQFFIAKQVFLFLLFFFLIYSQL